MAREYALAGGFLAAFAIRAAALRWDWSLAALSAAARAYAGRN
jgi:uncharacterized membrane protein YeiH